MMDVKQEVSSSGFGLGVCLLIIFFWGDPDLCDALIHFLMALKP